MARGSSKFDQMFANLTGEDGPSEIHSQAPSRCDAAFAGGTESQIQKAMTLFHGGRYAHCLSEVRKLDPVAGDDPRAAVLMVACNALISGQLRQGIDRCAELIDQAFYIPDLYCALGVLLVKARRRARAYQVFRKGLELDPRNRILQSHIRNMGMRRRPVLRFLGRTHPANRALGLLRSRLAPAA